MENGEKIPWSFLKRPSLVLFVLFSWGIVLLPPALVSKRPTGEPDRPREPGQENRYESRLWQDPFDVLTPVRSEQTQGKYVPRPCPKAAFHSEAHQEETLILAVFLRGECYPEEEESRLRSRYAVVSALYAAGYAADEAGDLRCLSMPYLNLKGPPWPVCPFERFTLRESETNREHDDLVSAEYRQVNPLKNVVVVWVDERLLDETKVGPHPLEALTRLTEQLKMGVPGSSLAILGPQSSDTLRALLFDKGDEQHDYSDGVRTPIYSFASTVAALRKPQTPPSLLEKYFKLVYVIGTDHELAEALSAELKLRGVKPAIDPSKIALVAEWDTYYGRSMIEEFSKELRGAGAGNDGRVRCFTYLRGIDGRLADSPGAELKEGSKSGDQAKGVLAGGEPLVVAPHVQAFGRSQIDYLPRLVDQMKAENGTVKAENGIAQRWNAIGVLGSDLYDKIMLIEVLRHAFPEALIFTTDLDARYLDTDNYHVTRNVLVASHYGLELNKGLQGAIPTFRSVYQTSLFFGCLKAIYDKKGNPAHHAASLGPSLARGAGSRPSSSRLLETRWTWEGNDANPKPLVFEIGRSRALPLTEPGSEGLHPEAYGWTEPLDGVQWLCLFILVLAGAVLGGIMLSVLRGRPHRFETGATSKFVRRKRAALILLGIVFIVFIVVIKVIVHVAAYDNRSFNGEPFSIFEGVSNWPTILLRVTAAAYCLYALIRAYHSDLESQEKLEKDYKLENVQQQRDKAQPQGAQDQPKCENPLWAWVKKLQIDWSLACGNPPQLADRHGRNSRAGRPVEAISRI